MATINRPYASGYDDAGASATRRALKGFLARSISANEDINWNNYTLRQRARMLYMSAPVATSAINTNRTKVVGTGLTLKSTIERDALTISPAAAKQWQHDTEREFNLWAGKRENCDATGINNFASLQQLAIKSWLMSGDVFVLFKRVAPSPACPYTLRLHLIEADRVSTPRDYGLGIVGRVTDGKNPNNGNRIFDGVEVDAHGKVVAYYICSNYPGQYTVTPLTWTRVEAYGKKSGLPNILHVMDSERPDQYRGLTYLAQVIEPLLNINRYTQSELMGALVQSFFTAWITTASPSTDLPLNEVYGENDDGSDSKVSDNENTYEMGPATVSHLKEGESITFGNPNIPTAGYEVFTRAVCKTIGSALEIPYDVLMKEYNASYSASRAAIMEAWEAFRMRRQWLIDDMCQPIYNAWLAEAVAVGRVKAPGFFDDPRTRAAWCGARWIGPVQGQLDPVKEINADISAVSHGFKTHEQIAREYGGGDWEENIEQVARENVELAAALEPLGAMRQFGGAQPVGAQNSGGSNGAEKSGGSASDGSAKEDESEDES